MAARAEVGKLRKQTGGQRSIAEHPLQAAAGLAFLRAASTRPLYPGGLADDLFQNREELKKLEKSRAIVGEIGTRQGRAGNAEKRISLELAINKVKW